MLTAALLALLVLLAVGVAVALVVAVGCAVHLVRHRGEAADTGDYYDTDGVSQGMRDAWDALNAALANARTRADDRADQLVAELVDDYYGTDVIQAREDVRDALDYVLADDAEVCRRLEPIARDYPDLAALPRRLQDLYLIEVEQ